MLEKYKSKLENLVKAILKWTKLLALLEAIVFLLVDMKIITAGGIFLKTVLIIFLATSAIVMVTHIILLVNSDKDPVKNINTVYPNVVERINNCFLVLLYGCIAINVLRNVLLN